MSDKEPSDETRTAPNAGAAPTRAAPGIPGGDRGAPAGIELAEGAHFGRYLILGRLAEGGMGAVYTAHDPQLDRKVALKLLLPELLEAEDLAQARARMFREAQALARLSHPNVVAIFEAGEAEGQVFLAMELVEGPTLRAWLRSQPRPWQDVLAAFLEAGKGLAAAHAKGLVHRDFKPHNVVMASDGRPRVLDFGLARTGVEASPPQAPVQPEATPSSGSLGQLTRTGIAVGTPGYMAPEQVRGAAVDARSDQFSFCVALYEALFGALPWEAPSLWALDRAFTEGKKPNRPGGVEVPRWAESAVLRGLEIDPARRWPSMEALLQDLAQRQREAPTPQALRWRRVRRALTFGTVLLALAAAGFFGAERYGLKVLEAQCSTDAQACMRAGALHHFLAERWSGDYRPAERMFARACELGNSVGCAEVALLYDYRLPEDRRMVAHWSEKACGLGDLGACAWLADLYLVGNGVPRDEKKAVELLESSCAQGSPFGCERLGTLLAQGKVVPQDLPRSRQIHTANCEAGFGESCVHLAVASLDGEGIPVDPAAGARYARLACERGNPGSERERCELLGQLLVEGRGVERDVKRGLEYLSRSCDRRRRASRTACATLARFFGTPGTDTRDIEKAVKYFDRACELNDAASCAELAKRLAHGEPDLPANVSWANTLNRKACGLGVVEACALAAPGEVPESEPLAR